jgi:hypothetical protein
LLAQSDQSFPWQVSSVEEITSVRGMYDKELSHDRMVLDETAKDEAKFKINNREL